MLHTYVEEKRARVSQMWLRIGSDRSRRTFTVREGLSEASTVADGLLSSERSGFCRRRYATLGLLHPQLFLIVEQLCVLLP